MKREREDIFIGLFMFIHTIIPSSAFISDALVFKFYSTNYLVSRSVDLTAVTISSLIEGIT